VIVVDASAAVGLVVPSQLTSASTAFIDSVAEPLISPFLLLYEVRSALLRLERQKRLTRNEVDHQLVQINDIVEDIRPAPSRELLARIVEVARRGGLGFFDACYLDLAMSEQAGLVTRDGAIASAAAQAGVRVFDLR
jgi:predicted nucleic acid-binding protein